MNKLLTKMIVVASILLSFLFLVGCKVTLRDHTPPEFPWQAVRDLPNSNEVLYGSTPQKLIDLGMNPAHRFILEVKPEGVSNISASITVNGTRHSMQGSGGGLWTYESTNECQASYSYYYKVRYLAGIWGYKNKTRGSASNPLITTVTNFGSEIWYEPAGVPNSSHGNLFFEAGRFEEKTIVFQNLRDAPCPIYTIALNDMVGILDGINDNAKFELLDVPPLPLILNCGDSISFKVKCNVSYGTTATGCLVISANPNDIDSASWYIELKAKPGPI
ncbi:MAG TPA: hypothetical protein VMX36_04260 [Sedimentisphaerales bacterium]|nr:hypothetical protein [Sedimentisphaerales bacterium]